MNLCAIICEYNPFHKGHEYHIQKARELTDSDGIIGVMSGNFAQRGIPTIIDKWERTKMALSSGVDLVIELPTIFSVSSAEFFSNGAIKLLDSLKIIDYLCFGSEYGNIDLLQEISHALIDEQEDFKNLLKSYLKDGYPFTSARSLALQKYLVHINPNINIKELSEILASSNNILGIEYCKSLLNCKSKIKPVTIKRLGAAYNENNLDSIFSSATSIRKFIKDNNAIDELEAHLPINVFKIIKNLFHNNYNFINEESLFPYVKYKLATEGESLKAIPEASEGLNNKILKEFYSCGSFNELVSKVKSKRYTYTRISRILCQYFIGFEKYHIETLRKESPTYVRILGLNKKGADIINAIKKSSDLEIITKLPKEHNSMLKLDIQATKAYSIINKNVNYKEDFLRSPIVIK